MLSNFNVGDSVIGRSNECPVWRRIVNEVLVNRERTKYIVLFQQQFILNCFPNRLWSAEAASEPSSDGSEMFDKDPESSEESLSDFDDDRIENG